MTKKEGSVEDGESLLESPDSGGPGKKECSGRGFGL